MFMKDLRFAFRALARSPGYTIVALTTLVLGIAANAIVFSLVKGVLLTPLDFPESDRLVRIREVSGAGGQMQVAWQNFKDWHDAATVFDGFVIHTPGGEGTVLGTGQPLRVGISAVSEGFFATLRVPPEVGRTFSADEHRRGASPAVVVSDAFWRTHLGARPDFAEQSLTMAGYTARVVGVMPRGFDYPGKVDILVSGRAGAGESLSYGAQLRGTGKALARRDLDAREGRTGCDHEALHHE